jgi:two-component system LytT family sensor kinase
MAITVNGQNIYFNILNNKAFNTNPKNANSSGGIGLNNVKKRLDLIYPERHELKISENQDTYSVNLLINTRL